MKTQLAFVEWSPDGKSLLFVSKDSEVSVHDSMGNKVSNLALYVVDNNNRSERDCKIVGVHWYDGCEGHISQEAPTLAIAFRDGKVQITRGRFDENAVLIDTGMELTQVRWNNDGSVIALAGTQYDSGSRSGGGGESKEFNVVQFYNPFGPLAWEGTGLRICLAVDSYIYFANIRPAYKWGFYSNTLVYTHNRVDQIENCVVFWDTKSDERYTKYIKGLLGIKAAGDNCVLVTKVYNEDLGELGVRPRDPHDQGSFKEIQYHLILCDTIGSPIETKVIDFEPVHVSMTNRHIAVASSDAIYVWQYRNSSAKLTGLVSGNGPANPNAVDISSISQLLQRGGGREKIFYVDEMQGNDMENFRYAQRELEDPICAICASDSWIALALNCNSTLLGVIDINGMMTIMELGSAGSLNATQAKMLDFEKKDAWDMMWAEDNPELFVMMEKARMYVYRGLEPEEPVSSSGYLCYYKDLQVKAALLDEILSNPDQPNKGMIIDFQTRSLRDAKELLDNVGLAEACDGIQYIKRLQLLNDRVKQKAEVAAYFQQFGVAEELYCKIDRKDLAIDLRQRLGDWFKVVQLVQSGGGNDTLLTHAWNMIGEYYADRHKWEKAIKYYAQVSNISALAHCFYTLGDFNQLESLVSEIPENSPLLKEMAVKFTRAGLCSSAVEAYLRMGDVKSAIDSCVLLNEWERAVTLAEQHNFPQIENVLTKYANHLMMNGKTMQAIELYRHANKSTEAAKLLGKLAKDMNKNPLRAKKLQVLAAFEVERMRPSSCPAHSRGKNEADVMKKSASATVDKKKDEPTAKEDENEEDGDEEDAEGEDDEESDEDVEEDTGLTENQNRLLYLISLYSKPAIRSSDKEEWIRKPELLVLLYEAIVSKALDYDYAPSSEIVENKRKYFNISQEGKSDIDFLREEDLVNGLKLSSKSYQPVTCFQISEKGLEIVSKISKTDKLSINDMAYAPGTLHLLRVEWDGDEYWLVDDDSGYRRLFSVTETEDVSYVSSAYIPQCLRFGGRPTLSNAHRAHECGVSDSSVRDQLDEIITLNSVSLIVSEYIPFGSNQVVQLNCNLGSTERVQGGFFTAIVDDNASGTQISVDPGLTSINILDYTMTNHVNFEADIHFPKAPGVVQVETFGCSLTAAGSCFYGMQVEAIMDRIKDNISLDHLSRLLLVDVRMDSSKIVDSVLSAYQRSLLNLIFSNQADSRNKINLIIANEITPHLTAEEYMDKGEYENGLKQIIGDTRAAFDIGEHDTLIFGAYGLLIVGPNSRHHEPLLCSFLQYEAMNLFTQNFFARMFIVVDDMKQILLCGSLASQILDRVTGTWTVVDTDWMKNFLEVMMYANPGLWFFFSLLIWAIVGAAMLYLLHFMGFKSKGVITIKVERKEAIFLKNLTAFLRTKLLSDETHHFEGGVKIAKVVWTEKDKKEWGGTPPTIEVTLTFAFQAWSANAKPLAFNADELYTRLIQELDKVKIFVNPESSAALMSSKSPGAVLPPAAAKKEETSPPSATKK
ncbi:hypothetical protein FI667_g4547, partial [Globisporangium splendens]